VPKNFVAKNLAIYESYPRSIPFYIWRSFQFSSSLNYWVSVIAIGTALENENLFSHKELLEA